MNGQNFLGVPGLTVQLQDTSGNVLATTVTNLAGHYRFNQLSGPAGNPVNSSGVSATGNYNIVLILPSFLTQLTGPGTVSITAGDDHETGKDSTVALNGQAPATTTGSATAKTSHPETGWGSQPGAHSSTTADYSGWDFAALARALQRNG
jgi:hypothetical protein